MYKLRQYLNLPRKLLLALTLVGASVVLGDTPLSFADDVLSWQVTQGLPVVIASRDTVVHGQSLYLIGGRASIDQPLAAVYCNQIGAGVLLSNWNRLPTDLPRALYGHAVVSTETYIYLIGGWDGSTARNEVFRSQILGDCSLGAWEPVNFLPTVLQTHDAAILNNRIYVTGGFDSQKPLATTYVSTIDNNGNLSGWTQTKPLPHPLFLHASVATNSDLYVIGGYDNQTAHTEIYRARPNSDGTISVWEPLEAALPSARFYSEALVRNHSLIVVGGSDGTTRYPDVLSFAIDDQGVLQREPDLPSLTSVLGPQGARFRFGIALGSLGQIYVIGGMDENRNVRDTVYVLSPPPGLTCSMRNSPAFGIPEKEESPTPTIPLTYTITCKADPYYPVKVTIKNEVPKVDSEVLEPDPNSLTGGDDNDFTNNTATWTIDQLKAGDSRSVTYELKPQTEHHDPKLVVVSEPATADWEVINPADNQPPTGIATSNVVINGPGLFMPEVHNGK